MAFERNNEILPEVMAKPEFSMQAIGEAFKGYATEPERVQFLKELFNNSVAYFDCIPLWEDAVPDWSGEPEYHDQNKPQIAFFPAKGENPSKGTVIVMPGGGFNEKSVTLEGYPIIRRLIEDGINAVLLDYRVKPYSVHVSFEDCKRAIRVLRYRAEELGIDPDKIVVHGSSAGGMLCVLAAKYFDYGDPSAEDPVERMSCRPDGAMPAYGVFVSANQRGKGGLGSPYTDEDRKEIFFLSAEKGVTPETSPFFMWCGCDEDDPRGICEMGRALADAGVRYEAHIFPNAPHGIGLANGDGTRYNNPHVAHWYELGVEWLKENIGF